MKIAFTFFLLVSFLHALPQGINFKEKISLQDALKQAVEQDRLVFIDFFTDWCKPCKQMDLEVFSKSSPGEFFNQNFINIKLNAEKGENIAVAKRFNINAYPTYIFLNENGSTVIRFSGLISEEELMGKAKIALTEKNDPNTFEVLQQRYFKQPNSTNLFKYLQKRTSLAMTSDALIKRYFDNLPQLEILSKKNFDLLTAQEYVDIQSRAFKFLWKAYNLSTDSLFKEKAFHVLEMSLRLSYHKAVRNKSLKDMNYITSLNKQISMKNNLYKPEWEYWELFYRRNNQYAEYVKYIIPRLADEAKNAYLLSRIDQNVLANTLNNAGEFLFRGFNDSISLHTAKALLEKAIDMKPDRFPTNFLIHYTYDNVQHKLGNTEEAKRSALKALSLITEDDSRFNFKKRIKNDLEKMEKHLPTW